MKILFTIALILIQILTTFSQCISIELSIKWKKGFDVFQKDSTVCFPELSIIYRNNSDTSLYFTKVSEGRHGYPILPMGTFIQYPIEEYLNPDYQKRAKHHGNYANNQYDVLIGGGSFFAKGWIVEQDTLISETECAIDIINDDLADIYKYLTSNFPDSTKTVKMHYTITDITPDDILKKYKDKFVFLRPGEIYTDTYNLIGFKLVRGCFTFYIEPNSLQNYVITSAWDKNQSKYIEIRAALPKAIGEYKLYFGDFISNKITITF